MTLAGVLSFVLVCTLGTMATTSGGSRLSATLAALLLSLAPAAVYGFLAHVLARRLGPRLAALVEPLALRRFVDRDPAAPRQPVITLHAAALALPVWLGLMLVASKLLVVRLRGIESADLRETLSLIGIAALLGVGVALALASLWPLRRAFAWLDGRATLPLPRSASLRTVLWLGLPLCVVVSFALWFLEPLMGPLVAPLWLVLVIGVQLCVSPVLRSRPIALGSQRARAAKALLLAIVAAAGLAGAHRVLASSGPATLALERARPGGMLVRSLRKLSDVDRDGASAFFGERDCAGLSAARGPLARDVAGNGIDEDCDGKDDKRGALPEYPLFYGGLPEDAIKSYDIVWFVVDAVRADHTSLLGYKRKTTPHLDELARESVVFTNAYSQSSATMLSFPSMLAGIDPGRLRWAKDRFRMQVAKEQRSYLAHMLASKRYQTGFVAAPYIEGMLPGLLDGWSWVGVASREQKDSSSTAATLAAQFIFRAREKPDPFALVTYLAAPHGPYVTHGESYPKLPKGEKDRYDAEIMNADRYINFVLDVLRADPERWEKTIVVVTSDHGEEFKERGNSNHATTCHIESVHVPLLVRIPGQKAARVTRAVTLLDIVPTLLELVGVKPARPELLDGNSLLLSMLAPERVSDERPVFCTVVSQKAAQGDFARRSVLSGKWKLMQELRGSKQLQLFNIEDDRKESGALATDGEHAGIARRLDEWLRMQLTGNVHQIDMTGE